MRADYFSIGALIGATFAGLWAGTIAWLMANGADWGNAPALAYILAIPVAIVSGGFLGFLVAVVGSLPIAAAAAFVVFPLTRFVKGRLAPTRSNAAALGMLVGAMPIGIISIVDAIAVGSYSDALSIIFAGAVGGAAGGLMYRALLFYRYPNLASE